MWQEDMHLAICGKTKTDYYFAILNFNASFLQLKNRVINLSGQHHSSFNTYSLPIFIK